MGRFLVMDVVFYGSSLNYDQGSGNYQELKKITRWDGRQYTLVSRYALRYSLLETGKKLGLWEVADGSKFVDSGTGDKTVIQPAVDFLLGGEILLYPEFDLFGYLVTSLTPQASRTSPAKLSHAVSMTPFTYDTQFAGNIGLAKRRLSIKGKMDINLFTIEEHETYYLYSLVVDVDELCKNEVYLSAKDEKWNVKVDEQEEKYTITISGDKAKKAGVAGEYTIPKRRECKIKDSNGNLLDVVIETKVQSILGPDKNPIVYKIVQTLKAKDDKVDLKKERLKQLVRAILHLQREIKGRPAIINPSSLVVLGVYKNTPYRTFKDRIQLVDEYTEEEYDEIERDHKDNKEIIRVKHRVSKSKKPVFQIIGLSNVEESHSKEKGGAEKTKEDGLALIIKDDAILKEIDRLFTSENRLSEVKVFHDPSVEVRPK